MKQKIIIIFLCLALLVPVYQAHALAFGGKIVLSTYHNCFIGIVWVPIQAITISEPTTPFVLTLAYPYYSILLQILGIYGGTYNYVLSSGTLLLHVRGIQLLGTYLPIPGVPWNQLASPDCAAIFSKTTNVITKIGSSLVP